VPGVIDVMNNEGRAGGPEPWSSRDAWAEGWYADPWETGRQRRWTGTAWTAETRGGDGPWISALGGAAPPAAPLGPPPAPLGPPPAPDGPPPASPHRNRRRLLALVATLAAIGLVLGFTIAYVGADSGSKAFSSTATTLPPATATPPSSVPANGSTPAFGSNPSAGTPRSSTPGSSPSGNGSSGSSGSGSAGGGSSAAPTDPSASVLSKLVVHQVDVPSADAVVLQPNGNSLTQPTLDLCNGTFPSESLRTARLQVDLTKASGDSTFSTEAVLYGKSAGSVQAFAELRSVVAACPSTPVVSPVGEVTVTTKFNPAPDAKWANVTGVERLAYDFTTTDTTGSTTRSVAVYLRRGRALIGLYFANATGAQEAVAGNTTIPSIVNLFERRLAAVPAASITP